MLGAIIGDVVGSRFEIHNIKTKKFLMFHPYCHITDDSVMTIAVAKSLCQYVAGMGKLEDLCVENMQAFGRKVFTTYGEKFYKWIWSDNPQPYNSFGNGAAMRVSPVAYFVHSLEECRELARKVTGVTHNHPQALKAAECVACCVYLSIHNYDKEFIRNFVNENYYKLDFTLDEIRDSYTYRGDCDGTVPYAIECFLEGENFEDVIRNAISIGGDSDTVAVIAGSIAEAMMPRKYYKIARHYCRKNLFLWRQFKYVEMARTFVMETYCNSDDRSGNLSSLKHNLMWLPFVKKRKYHDCRALAFRFSRDPVQWAFNLWHETIELERSNLLVLNKNGFKDFSKNPNIIEMDFGVSYHKMLNRNNSNNLIDKISAFKNECIERKIIGDNTQIQIKMTSEFSWIDGGRDKFSIKISKEEKARVLLEDLAATSENIDSVGDFVVMILSEVLNGAKVFKKLYVPKIVMYLGSNLLPIVEKERGERLLRKISNFKEKFFEKKSVNFSIIRIMDNCLMTSEFSISIFDKEKIKKSIENSDDNSIESLDRICDVIISSLNNIVEEVFKSSNVEVIKNQIYFTHL